MRELTVDETPEAESIAYCVFTGSPEWSPFAFDQGFEFAFGQWCIQTAFQFFRKPASFLSGFDFSTANRIVEIGAADENRVMVGPFFGRKIDLHVGHWSISLKWIRCHHWNRREILKTLWIGVINLAKTDQNVRESTWTMR